MLYFVPWCAELYGEEPVYRGQHTEQWNAPRAVMQRYAPGLLSVNLEHAGRFGTSCMPACCYIHQPQSTQITPGLPMRVLLMVSCSISCLNHARQLQLDEVIHSQKHHRYRPLNQLLSHPRSLSCIPLQLQQPWVQTFHGTS